MAVALIPEYLLNQKINEDNIKYHLEQAIKYTNKSILNEAIKRPELEGMGTTVVSMFFLKNNLYITNVGDSRAYLVHSKQLYQFTRDHSLVQEKINLGIYTRQQAIQDPMKNVLIRTVGYEDIIKVDIFTYKISCNDFFLLCSDGLYGKVNDQDMLTLLHRHIPATQKCTKSQMQNAVQALVDQANHNGGNDNISVIISKAE